MKAFVFQIIIALERGNFTAAKDALDNGADVNKAGKDEGSSSFLPLQCPR